MFQGMSGHAEATVHRVAVTVKTNFILSVSKSKGTLEVLVAGIHKRCRKHYMCLHTLLIYPSVQSRSHFLRVYLKQVKFQLTTEVITSRFDSLHRDSVLSVDVLGKRSLGYSD